jgi:hypothetical protein
MNHLSHSWRSTLDEALLRRRHQSDEAEDRSNSCTQANEARLYLHMLIIGTGEERRQGREEHGRTLFHDDITATTALTTPSET